MIWGRSWLSVEQEEGEGRDVPGGVGKVSSVEKKAGEGIRVV